MKRVLVLLAVAACSAASEDVCRAPLTKDMDLLGAHLTMRVPSQVRIEQRQRSIMAAPESQQEETRAVIGSSGSEMIFVVQESSPRLLATSKARSARTLEMTR